MFPLMHTGTVLQGGRYLTLGGSSVFREEIRGGRLRVSAQQSGPLLRNYVKLPQYVYM